MLPPTLIVLYCTRDPPRSNRFTSIIHFLRPVPSTPLTQIPSTIHPNDPKMSRTFFVGGNWKCNGTTKSITELCAAWKTSTDDGAKYNGKPVEIVIAPPALYAHTTKALLPANFEISLQDCYTATGAYTGEIAADMLVDAGIPWVITGHSERRSKFGESDKIVADKTAYALSKGIKVIACIGELLEEREAGNTMAVNERQLSAIAAKVSDWSNVVIAYEPVWAIGTGKVATPAQAQEVHAALRAWLAANISPEVAEAMRIIYGGSVKPANANDLSTQTDIDGFLVGGASLKPDFIAVIDSYAA